MKGTMVYYRGRRVLDALLSDLIVNQGMSNATEVFVTGCSAGFCTHLCYSVQLHLYFLFYFPIILLYFQLKMNYNK